MGYKEDKERYIKEGEAMGLIPMGLAIPLAIFVAIMSGKMFWIICNIFFHLLVGV